MERPRQLCRVWSLMAGTPIPTLFFGRAGTSPGEADVWQWSVGATDAAGPSQTPPGDAITPLAKTVRFFPAGFKGEAIFTNLWIGLTADMDAITLRFTPIVDEVVYDGTLGNPDLRQTIAIAETPGTRVTQKVELALYLPYDNGVDPNAVRNDLRGSWFQLLVDTTTGLGVGDLIIDKPELEFEVVRESEAAQ